MPDPPTLTPISSAMWQTVSADTTPICQGCGQVITSTSETLYADPRVRPFLVWEARCIPAAIRPLFRGPAGEQLYYDAGELGEFDPAAVSLLRDAPIQQTASERLMLYALIYGLRPARYLEIGTRLGGSAVVVAAAMDAAKCEGRLFCIDPDPDITSENWARIEPRTTLVRGLSPAAVPDAARKAGGPFDVALIDGDHRAAAVYADAQGVLPYMRPGGFMLFHDAYTDEVRRALRRFVWRHPWRLIDLGYLTKEITIDYAAAGGPKRYCGLRVLQTRRRWR